MKKLFTYLAFMLLPFCIKAQQGTYEVKRVTYFEDMYKRHYVDTAIHYKITLNPLNILTVINLDTPDTLLVQLVKKLPEQTLSTGGMVKGYEGCFNGVEPAIVSFGILPSGRIVDVGLSDGKWLIIYQIYYPIQTEL